MKDPFNPTSDELAAWAKTPGAFTPVEDWDLIITHADSISNILELARQPNNPNWDFFLACLYLFVGDAFRSDFREDSQTSIAALLRSIRSSDPIWLHRWRDRSEALIQGTVGFDYELWCGHGFVAEERELLAKQIRANSAASGDHH